MTSVKDIDTDPLLADLALGDGGGFLLNQWDGFDLYGSGNTFIRTTVEDGLYHVYGFDGYDLAWSVEFSDDTPDAVVQAAIRAAYGTLSR